MRKLMWFTLGFAAGCALCVYLLPVQWQLIALAAAIAALGLCLCLPDRIRRFAVCLFIGVSFGVGWCAVYRQLFIGPILPEEGETVQLSAEACGIPEKRAYGTVVQTNVCLDGKRTKALLTLTGFEGELQPGDIIRGTFRLKPALLKNERENYSLISRGIQISGTGWDYAVSPPETERFGLFPQRLAVQLNQSLSRSVPRDCLGFLQAIVTADRTNLSELDRNNLSVSGASHVIAISGMHVSMLVMMLLFVFCWDQRLAAVICIPVLVLFVAMTGASPSVVRAAVMQSILVMAPVFRRENDPPTSLSAAALVLLLQNPWVITNVSFQLSFSAVAGLLLVTPTLYAWMKELSPINRLLSMEGRRRLGNYLFRVLKAVVRFAIGCVSATLGALLLTVPISAYVFGTVPLYGLLTNLLILPVVLLCFVGGLLTAVSGLFLPGFAAAAGKLTAIPVRYILLVCGRIASWPFAALQADNPYVIAFLLAVYAMIGAAWLMHVQRLELPLGGIAAALMLTLIFYGRSCRFSSFAVAALDVGQGQCICMQTKSFTAVVDCGGDSGTAAGSRCAGYLKDAGAYRIDALVLTHYDVDHINGVETLLSRISVQTLYLADVPFDEEARLRVEELAQSAGAEIIYVTSDLQLTFPEGSMTIYSPVSLYDDNAASLAVLFSAGDYDMLVTGDMDIYSEYDLMITHELPQVEAFVAGHHGSKYSSSEELLDTIKPQTVLISAGKNNYGHPSREALSRFAAVGATVLRTDESGDIIIRR